MRADGCDAKLSVHMIYGTYKYFFENYKDYYYLPLEDRALHKSVGSLVDKKYRKQATAATCYEKQSGAFLPVSDLTLFSPVFKETPKSTTGFIKSDTITNDNIYDYCNMLLKLIKDAK